MTDTTIYDTINNIPEDGFIAGTDKEWTFQAYQENGVDTLNLTGGIVTWFLCPYGQFSQNILEYDTDGVSPAGRVELGAGGTFTVYIPAADTLALSGKYIQQLSITDYEGKTFRPGQGSLIITPAVQAT